MDQKEFEKQVLTELQGQYPDLHFELRDVEKLQSGPYRGLAVSREGSQVTALINIAPFHARVESDEDFRRVTRDLSAKVEAAMRETAMIDPERISDYGKVQGMLSVQLVCAYTNRELLGKYPHRVIGDMAMIVRINMGEKDGQTMSAAVTNSMLESFGISKETLFSDAITTGMYRNPPTLCTIMEELGGMLDMPVPAEPKPGTVPCFWVATTEQKSYGAAVILYPGFLDEAAKKIGSDFYIIPSSVHEMLFLPDTGEVKADDLARIQHEVNETELMPEELLSHKIFYYDAAERKLELASEHEARKVGKTADGPEVQHLEQSYGERPSRPDETHKATETPVKGDEWMEELLAESLPDKLPWPENSIPGETIHVLLIEPEKYPREVEISNDLKGLQGVVGGMIETVYPFDDEACIVCNDMGKLDGLPLNRALKDEKGSVADVIAGPFLIVGLQGDGFRSLDAEQMSCYAEQFHQPEVFIQMGRRIMALPIPDESVRLKEARRSAASKESGKDVGSKKAETGKDKARVSRNPER